MLADFLKALFDHGHIVLPVPSGNSSADELQEARAVLIELEASWRLEFPGAAPKFDSEAALWGLNHALPRGAEHGLPRDW